MRYASVHLADGKLQSLGSTPQHSKGVAHRKSQDESHPTQSSMWEEFSHISGTKSRFFSQARLTPKLSCQEKPRKRVIVLEKA